METLKEGIFIMAIGMGTVFMFLVVMVYSINICTKVLLFINKYMPEELPEQLQCKVQRNDNNAEIALAIACAAAAREGGIKQ